MPPVKNLACLDLKRNVQFQDRNQRVSEKFIHPIIATVSCSNNKKPWLQYFQEKEELEEGERKKIAVPFTQKVREIIRDIPEGRVTTYGIVALYADNSSGARQVARILHSSSAKYDLPWHRVVSKGARISLPPGKGYEVQRQLLEQEGVVFDKYNRIDFEKYLWWPGGA